MHLHHAVRAGSKVNNPDWNFEFVSDSNVLEYVSPEMLPAAYWTWGKPANKKDACFDDLNGLPVMLVVKPPRFLLFFERYRNQWVNPPFISTYT